MIDWDKTFAEANGSLCIQNAKPPHETARNIFKDDEPQIMKAATKHGYRIIGDKKAKVVSFVKGGGK